jgi:hypothetical protein
MLVGRNRAGGPDSQAQVILERANDRSLPVLTS